MNSHMEPGDLMCIAGEHRMKQVTGQCCSQDKPCATGQLIDEVALCWSELGESVVGIKLEAGDDA